MEKTAGTLKCDIVSSRREIFSGEITLFVASGVAGDLGITPRHVPLITELKPGPVKVISADGEESIFYVGGGILEVMPHVITVMADEAERAVDLDEAAALKARDEAERELSTSTSEMDVELARLKLLRSLAELKAVEMVRRKKKR
ncbi:MAG: F0F1 ATP synthase subunit epsilon [Xanthomonadales bacterium]|nr:F0F1 ATP synthase subunit epsilon [Gammaproteobacteria bacterium]MBT8053507.1 F0F1 ATP synthase subunit epsilon [Gammaproteobacteria bacterium]NND55875.1 F0F1 ATP synthase subunit epsilon [Xanthomonadales bacterium]NNK50822.1 F0F1 ATP synthase subunit epsilon [Xanthomonadales bacterium]